MRKGERRLERLSFQPARAFRVTIGRTLAGSLKLARDAVSVDATPQHFSGRAGRDLFWSLRGAGVPAAAAREYLDALSTRTDLKSIGPKDEFDLVIEHLRDAEGKAESGPLLYAGLRRENGNSLRLVRWTVGDRTGWFDPSGPEQRVEGFEQPVRGGRVTSRFGYRMHPILGFGRFHDGLDIGAAWGSPVFAAADGVVTGAGWSGGYGRQVRLAHPDGIMTSYAHLSRILAVPGARVRRGQLIGLVGSSGFSTGAHLHFEVRRSGRPVDPTTFRYAGVQIIGATDLAALRARLEQLRSI
jgi:murein DD-endopeptidase MepM/ murein hydrolase activator NlpD